MCPKLSGIYHPKDSPNAPDSEQSSPECLQHSFASKESGIDSGLATALVLATSGKAPFLKIFQREFMKEHSPNKATRLLRLLEAQSQSPAKDETSC